MNDAPENPGKLSLSDLLALASTEMPEPKPAPELGIRDWDRDPPTLDEVKEWRRSREMFAAQRIMISLTGIGAAQTFAMSNAEKKYRELGLL